MPASDGLPYPHLQAFNESKALECKPRSHWKIEHSRSVKEDQASMNLTEVS